MKDLIIIGFGPAGMTASIYAKRKGIDFEVITKTIGGEIVNTSEIGNYLGFKEIKGPKLFEKFKEHIEYYKIKYKFGEVIRIKKNSDYFEVILKDNKVYKAKNLLLATGSTPRKLGLESENRLKGKGVSYCAICDGFLFKDKDVAIIGGGNSAIESVLMLKDIVNQIYLITNIEKLTAEKYLIDKIKGIKNLNIFYNSIVIDIIGKEKVESVKIKNLKNSKEKIIQISGVFINIGIVPNSNYIDIVKKNQKGEIIVDMLGRTSVKGIWAAGDVTNLPFKQIHIACGDAAKAILDISTQLG